MDQIEAFYKIVKLHPCSFDINTGEITHIDYIKLSMRYTWYIYIEVIIIISGFVYDYYP